MHVRLPYGKVDPGKCAKCADNGGLFRNAGNEHISWGYVYTVNVEDDSVADEELYAHAGRALIGQSRNPEKSI